MTFIFSSSLKVKTHFSGQLFRQYADIQVMGATVETRYRAPSVATGFQAAPLWSKGAVSTTLKIDLEGARLLFAALADRFTMGLSGGMGFTSVGTSGTARLVCSDTHADECNFGFVLSAGVPISYLFYEGRSIGVGIYSKPEVEMLVMNDPLVGARFNISAGFDFRAGTQPSEDKRYTHAASIVIGFLFSYPLAVELQKDPSYGFTFGFRLLLP